MRILAALAAALTLSACATAGAEDFRPEVIRFGATLEQMERALEGHCAQRRTRQIDPPFLDNVRIRQMQIDCDGFAFRGQGRHVEFVFRDDVLVMVWLMVATEEADGVVAAMEQAYGPASRRNQGYIAFEPARAAWRHRPAEILFYSEAVEGEMAENFD
jgi:hypothetical protein